MAGLAGNPLESGEQVGEAGCVGCHGGCGEVATEAGERGAVGIREAVVVVVSVIVCVSSQEEEVGKEEVGVMEWQSRVGRIESSRLWGYGWRSLWLQIFLRMAQM